MLYQRSDGSGCFAKASIQGRIVTFQLTERGVARGGQAAAKLLCPERRAAVAATTTLSLPLPLATLDALALLARLGKLPPGSAVVRTLRERLAEESRAGWDARRRRPAE